MPTTAYLGKRLKNTTKGSRTHKGRYIIIMNDKLKSFDELYDYANEDNVIFIEWSNCLADQELIEQHLAIDIKYISKNQRWSIISAKGERYENLLKELSNEN